MRTGRSGKSTRTRRQTSSPSICGSPRSSTSRSAGPTRTRSSALIPSDSTVDLVPLPLERARQRLGDRRVVFGEQHRRHGASLSPQVWAGREETVDSRAATRGDRGRAGTWPDDAPSPPDDRADDLALALRLADTADAITLTRFRAADLRVARKPDRTPVTDADTATEDALRSVLGTERAGDAVLGEERGGSSRRAAAGGCSTRSTAPRTSRAACRRGRR